MQVKEGTRFITSNSDTIYTIYKVEEAKCWINWDTNLIGVWYLLSDAKQNVENKKWKPLKQDKLKEHELMDRTSMILAMFLDFVLNPSKKCLQDEALVKEIETISENLWTLYQKLGNL